MKHKMKKRYDDGGSAFVSGAPKNLKSFMDESEAGGMTSAASEPKKETFKEAFAAARRKMLKEGGPKEFTWRGKSYTTELEKPKAPARVLSEPSTPYNPPAATPAATSAARAPVAATKVKTRSQTLAEESKKAAERRAARRAASDAQELRDAGPRTRILMEERRKAESRAATRKATTKANEYAREIKDAGPRTRMLMEERRRAEARRAGKTMAKGGSASKRADGCAIRGKTRAR